MASKLSCSSLVVCCRPLLLPPVSVLERISLSTVSLPSVATFQGMATISIFKTFVTTPTRLARRSGPSGMDLLTTLPVTASSPSLSGPSGTMSAFPSLRLLARTWPRVRKAPTTSRTVRPTSALRSVAGTRVSGTARMKSTTTRTTRPTRNAGTTLPTSRARLVTVAAAEGARSLLAIGLSVLAAHRASARPTLHHTAPTRHAQLPTMTCPSGVRTTATSAATARRTAAQRPRTTLGTLVMTGATESSTPTRTAAGRASRHPRSRAPMTSSATSSKRAILVAITKGGDCVSGGLLDVRESWAVFRPTVTGAGANVQ